jgi:hypothetical protein
VGEYAAAFTKGMQENPADRGHMMASACCKHFAANSMEGTTQHGVSWSRHNFSADVPAQDLAGSTIQLPHITLSLSDVSHPDLICLSIVYVQTVTYHHSRSAWRRVKSQGSCGERVPPSLLPIRQLRLYICCLILTVLLLQHNL